MTSDAETRDPYRGPHYAVAYRGIRLDPYRVLLEYRITHPALQHAIKKLLRAGRGGKSLEADIEDAIATLVRFQVMSREDQADGPVTAEELEILQRRR